MHHPSYYAESQLSYPYSTNAYDAPYPMRSARPYNRQSYGAHDRYLDSRVAGPSCYQCDDDDWEPRQRPVAEYPKNAHWSDCGGSCCKKTPVSPRREPQAVKKTPIVPQDEPLTEQQLKLKALKEQNEQRRAKIDAVDQKVNKMMHSHLNQI